MIVIEINDSIVTEIIQSVCASVTEQVAGIKLENISSAPVRIDNPLSVVVMSRGNFMSKAIMMLPHEFADRIIDRMSNGEELSPEEREAYFQEFVNIFFGRFISAVNNRIGRPSRFVIPVVLHGTYHETSESYYKNRVEVYMSGDEGKLRIIMKYEVLPDYVGSQG